jgi:hypothetical protein
MNYKRISSFVGAALFTALPVASTADAGDLNAGASQPSQYESPPTIRSTRRSISKRKGRATRDLSIRGITTGANAYVAVRGPILLE